MHRVPEIARSAPMGLRGASALYRLAARNRSAVKASQSYIRRYVAAPAKPTLLSPKFAIPWLKALELKNEKIQIDSHPAKPPLTPKRMTDSYSSYTLEFGKDEWLVDSYVNSTGQLRLGNIFMDLDALAGVIAYKHAGEGHTIVTAAVDRISLLHPPHSFCDMELRGMVTWTSNRSSMEISLEVVGKEENKTVLTCQFTMVALDPMTKRATNVNPLVVETPEEKRIFARGEERNKFKKTLASTSLEKQAPNEEESNLIHKMWQEEQSYKDTGIEKPANLIYMSDTQIQTTQIMQPQIFGGLLLRNTFELAFTCCAAASHSRPRFISMSPSVFRESVPVGGILYLTATVVHTEPAPAGGSRVQVRVDSKVRDIHHSSLRHTGTFTYTFDTEELFQVMPKTYGEFVSYIDARRKAEAERSWVDTRDEVPDNLEVSIVE
ncbi:hypothetical protein H072_10865 [Dactylellina haptotyla CBS 200.50]|uniref:HotDog ACOT-type domain-containing protein n=1 Tax=Dactylellina haptotyla (strain CBS 200.50) TaxID=1284197 RepID=S7ZZ53_DACHA|nr:hypothetical protein H072_10865 [Dactylellina haptotyla CBS 200.50]